MNYKLKQILKLADYDYRNKYRIKCPVCRKKSLILFESIEKGKCHQCNKSWSFDDILVELEDNFLDNHKNTYKDMTGNTGVDM